MRNPAVVYMSLLALATAATRAQPVSPVDPPAEQEPKKKNVDTAEEFFASGPLPRLRVELTPENLNKLRQDGRAYVEATVRETMLGADGPEVVYGRVGVHLKGGAGSYRDVDDRPGLTLDFDRYVPGKTFHGLSKIHLNNSVQDPSYMSENLGNALFRAAGVPAARVTYARVWINQRDLGVFVLKEGFADEFLKRFFDGPRGTLYEGGFLRDIDGGLAERVNAGQARPERVKELIAAAGEGDAAARQERLGAVLDVDRFRSFMAVETMTAHWDGYCPNVNNYRVYDDPASGRFVFLPHGTDQLFQQGGFPLLVDRGMVARAVTAAPDDRSAYLERVAELRAKVFTPEALNKRLNEVSARLAPAMEDLGSDSARNHREQTEGLRRRLEERVRNIDEQLASIPKPLKFEAGVAALSGARWQPQTGGGRATLDQVEQDGRSRLRIRSDGGGEFVASFRTTVTLGKGRYTFEGPCRTAGVAALEGQNSGAGLRISGARRDARLAGDADWQPLSFEFEVGEPTREVVLVCELRATAGEAWFDAGEMKLRRRPDR